MAAPDPRRLFVVVAAALVLGTTLGWLARSGPAADEGVTRYVHALPDSQTLGGVERGSVAVSPDGRRIAWFADDQLWVKAADDYDARVVEGAPAGAAPFFSPDGQWIAFSFGQHLWKIAAAGGSAERFALTGVWFYGGSWDDGFIWFANADGVMRVPEGGGDVETVVATTDPADAFGPRPLPGGDWLLYTLAESRNSNRWNESRIIARSLKTGEERVIGRGADARYLRTGHLMYALGPALYTVKFDARSLETTGVPVLVADPVQRANNPVYWGGTANYDVSPNGTLVYVAAVTSTGGTFVLVDRQGVRRPLDDLRQLEVASIRVSPDGERLAFATVEPGDVWVYEMATGRLRRLTDDGGNRWPEWVDNLIIAYTSGRAGVDNIFVQRWDRADEARQLTFGDAPVHLSASSGDGRRLAYHAHPAPDATTQSVLLLRVGPDDSVEITDQVVMPVPGDINSFSPDGSWVAYSAAGNVYVTRSDGSGGLVPVSTDGGGWGLWRTPNELFFRKDDQVLSASIEVEPEVRVGVPAVLFEGPFLRGPGAVNFEVLDGGRSFILVVPGEGDEAIGTRRDRFYVTTHWFDELAGQEGGRRNP